MELDHSQTLTADDGTTATVWHDHGNNRNCYTLLSPTRKLLAHDTWVEELTPQGATQYLLNRIDDYKNKKL